ncbi:energy-coupling factor transporter ATPase [Thermoactinomyces daqus]|uniref:Energy-coupling factor transporter ATP-binding protein EcfA2 n=1 Tax=Thermoactinomyces daqus TaxID=1329516 RepID=A0A7W2AH57_9BACL|nr:energy-coupling factor transporter ATPase [Thermoactinomyces daqus]MBA4542326.1 energy-coupling factor transporter ATPase [Thermoactinomyces daqus]
MEIVVRDLEVVYQSGTPWMKKALDGVNLTVPGGSFTAILGVTGSGKSTLIQAIAGLIRPTRGIIRIGSHLIDANRKQTADVRRLIGLVFQYPEHQLFAETVAKDIAFGPTNLGLPQSEVDGRVKQAMEWVGLDSELADRSPFQLSGGQMRRVAIAGVLAISPKILILDEPAAGLDPKGQEEILSLLKRLNQDFGVTVILVSHDMDQAVRYADRFCVLAEGRSVLSGTAKAVFSRADILSSYHLELPEITRFVQLLNRKLDPPLPEDVFTLDELERLLEERRKKRELP